MIVTDQNNIIASNGNRIIANDAINYFMGYVDNNWDNPLNWSLGLVPTNSHTCYIYANCNLPINTTVKGLVVEPGYTLTINTVSLGLLTSLENYGVIRYDGNVTLYGAFASWINQGEFTFTRSASQLINVQSNITFPANLVLPTLNGIQNAWTMAGDLTIMGDFTPNQTTLQIGPYNFTVMGSSLAAMGNINKSSGTGSVLLVGKVTTNGGKFFGSITGNPTIEMRGGFESNVSASYNIIFNSGNDFTIKCTTNNQTFTIGYTNSLFCTNLIADGVTVTINDTNTQPHSYSSALNNQYVQGLMIKGQLDGTNASSAIIINTIGRQAPLLNPGKPMSTAGTLQINNADGNKNAGFINCNYGSLAVDPYWGYTFDYVYFSAQASNATVSPVITVTQAMTVNKELDIRGRAKVDLGTNNLTVLGTTNIDQSSNGVVFCTLTGSTGGFWLFVGLCTINKGGIMLTNQAVNIEFRGGVDCNDTTINGGFTYDLGNGTVKFTTNNQTFNVGGLKASVSNILVDRGITLTLLSNNVQSVSNSSVGWLLLAGSMEGVDGSATIINKGFISWRSTALPMNTGALDLTSYQNVFSFNHSSNATIKGGTYWHLNINTAVGTAYNKTASSHITTLGDLYLNANSTLVLSNYNLIVNGAATFVSALNKTGSGSILFVGAVSFAFPPALASNVITECRGGFSYNNGASGTWGQYLKFTTNNQAIYCISTPFMAINILIDSGITCTLTNWLLCTGSINGVDATAKLINQGTIDFRAAGAIMATGLLYCDTAANTVIYNTTFAQTIQVPADGNYRNLTLTGSPSTKTVASPGTVNVRGTFTKNTGVTVVGTITNNP